MEAGTIINQYKIISAIGIGGIGEVFAEPEKAFEQNDWWFNRLKSEPQMNVLRDDPRYKNLLKRMGLPE